MVEGEGRGGELGTGVEGEGGVSMFGWESRESRVGDKR